jgi:hypothetical protein
MGRCRDFSPNAGPRSASVVVGGDLFESRERVAREPRSSLMREKGARSWARVFLLPPAIAGVPPSFAALRRHRGSVVRCCNFDSALGSCRARSFRLERAARRGRRAGPRSSGSRRRRHERRSPEPHCAGALSCSRERRQSRVAARIAERSVRFTYSPTASSRSRTRKPDRSRLSREASPVSVAKDGYQDNDDDHDPEPGRHS